MAKRLARRLAMLSFLFALLLTSAAADSTTHPLQASELLGLVAGNALPETVVREIATNGLAFRPDEPYRALLTTAGADAKILSALSSAKVSVEHAPDAEARDLQKHLATAGKAVGVSIGTAYKLVHEGKFPCPVIRLGHRYKVPTTGLMKALGIEIISVDPQDVADGAAFAARVR